MENPRPLTYCPHCKDKTVTLDIMYKMSINLMQNYPQICKTCNKDKTVRK